MRTDTIDELTLVDWPDDTGPPAFDTLRPSGLGDRAVLLIRSVSVIASTDQVGAAVGDEVERSLDHAVRPVAGRLPADAEVVLFDDEAQTLAAYLVALHDGTAMRQWWWRLAVPTGGVTAIGVLADAAHPAAVVSLLDDWGCADWAFEEASATDLHGLLRLVASQHALSVEIVDDPGVPAVLDPSPASAPADRVPGAKPAGVPDVVVRRDGVVVGRCADDVTGLRSLLVGVARAAVGARPHTTGDRARRSTVAPRVIEEHRAVAGVASSPAGSHLTRDVDPGRPRRRPTPVRGETGELAAAQPPRPVGHESAGELPDDPTAPPDVGSGPLFPDRSRPTPVAPSEASQRTDRTRVRTSIAGGLFVVNSLQHLDVPDELGSVAPWDVVEAVVRAFVGDVDDPLWSVLADLAGRSPGERVGDDVVVAAAPIRDRVAETAGLDPFQLGELLQLSGIVEYDTTHVDVHMALHDVRLETRRAGLDLDPGWVPRLGRVIRFHYRDDLP